MCCPVTLTNVEAIPAAVTRSRVSSKELSTFVPAAYGETWSFIRPAGFPRPGRHAALDLDTGLEWEECWNADPSKIRTDVFHLLKVACVP